MSRKRGASSATFQQRAGERRSGSLPAHRRGPRAPRRRPCLRWLPLLRVRACVRVRACARGRSFKIATGKTGKSSHRPRANSQAAKARQAVQPVPHTLYGCTKTPTYPPAAHVRRAHRRPRPAAHSQARLRGRPGPRRWRRHPAPHGRRAAGRRDAVGGPVRQGAKCHRAGERRRRVSPTLEDAPRAACSLSHRNPRTLTVRWHAYRSTAAHGGTDGGGHEGRAAEGVVGVSRHARGGVDWALALQEMPGCVHAVPLPRASAQALSDSVPRPPNSRAPSHRRFRCEMPFVWLFLEAMR